MMRRTTFLLSCAFAFLLAILSFSCSRSDSTPPTSPTEPSTPSLEGDYTFSLLFLCKGADVTSSAPTEFIHLSQTGTSLQGDLPRGGHLSGHIYYAYGSRITWDFTYTYPPSPYPSPAVTVTGRADCDTSFGPMLIEGTASSCELRYGELAIRRR